MSKVIPNLVRNYKIGEFTKVLTKNEAILYALSVGCNQDPMNRDDLKYTDVFSKDFRIIQSITAPFSVLDLDKIRACPGLPDYNRMDLLHGEQIIQPISPLEIGEKLISENSIVDIEDKRSGALITIESKIYKDDKSLVAVNLGKLFIRGIGGFSDNPGASPVLEPDIFPKPLSDMPIGQITLPMNENQAHLYRLASGDTNPLHIDPEQAEKGGFKRPILHGLCTLGFSTRAYQTVFDHHKFEKIGIRFTAPTIPGQTLLVKFFESSFKNETVFTTTAYDSNKSAEEGIIIAKGFFKKS